MTAFLTLALVFVVTVFIVPVIIVARLCHKAPLGYEDETGFHYGIPERKNAASRQDHTIDT